jgi:hypothetical protein
MKTFVISVSIGLLLISLCGVSFAQGLSSLTQMFGGSKHSQSSESNPGVVEKRSAMPYIGKFNGVQHEADGAELSAKFACYPAHDPALPQNTTFVCYSAKESAKTE